MPNVSLTVPEMQQSIARPVIHDIVRQVSAITKLPKDIPIYIPGDTETVSQKGSTINDSDVGGVSARLATDDNIQVEVTETFDEGNVLSTTVAQTGNRPFFMDQELGVIMRPAVAVTDVAITFKFTSNSRTLCDRWRSDIRMRIGMLRDINLHQINFHYPVPQPFFDVLFQIWKMREKVDGYGEDFPTYLQSCCSTNVTRISNEVGTITGFAMAATQAQVQGMFDFEYVPEKPTRVGNTEQWEISFTYNFRYDKPVMVNMKYPVVVHNQLMPKEYLTIKQPTNYSNKQLSYAEGLGAAAYFSAENRMDRARAGKEVTTIPPYDEFLASYKQPDSQQFLTVLCQVDKDDPTLMLNLAQLGTASLDPDILELVKKVEWKFIGKPYQSVLNVTAYTGSMPVNHEAFFVDEQLNVRSRVPMSMRKVHRVVFSLNLGLGSLPTAALMRLKMNPLAGGKLLRAIGVNHNRLMHVRQRVDLFSLVPEIKKNERAWRAYRETIPSTFTVQSSYVIARHQE